MFVKNIYFSSIRAKFSSSRPKIRLVNLNLVYIQLNLVRFELNNKKLYIYLSHFLKFRTWSFPISMEMVFHEVSKWQNSGVRKQTLPHSTDNSLILQ
jgi:hypothetical protein